MGRAQLGGSSGVGWAPSCVCRQLLGQLGACDLLSAESIVGLVQEAAGQSSRRVNRGVWGSWGQSLAWHGTSAAVFHGYRDRKASPDLKGGAIGSPCYWEEMQNHITEGQGYREQNH